MMLKRFWNDDSGFVVSAELVLVATVLVIGLIVGLVTVRDQVIQELGDTAVHLAAMNQSYSFSGITGHHSSSAGSTTIDRQDDCDGIPTMGSDDDAGSPPACIHLTIDGMAE